MSLSLKITSYQRLTPNQQSVHPGAFLSKLSIINPFPNTIWKRNIMFLNSLENNFQPSKLGAGLKNAYRHPKEGGGGNGSVPHPPFWGYVNTISGLPNTYIGKQVRNGNGRQVIHRLSTG